MHEYAYHVLVIPELLLVVFLKKLSSAGGFCCRFFDVENLGFLYKKQTALQRLVKFRLL